MHNYTVKKTDNYGYALLKDGVETFCPFQQPTPIPVPASNGQMQLMVTRMPCSTLCPFANFDKSNKKYTMNCLSCEIELNVESEIDPALRIIK